MVWRCLILSARVPPLEHKLLSAIRPVDTRLLVFVKPSWSRPHLACFQRKSCVWPAGLNFLLGDSEKLFHIFISQTVWLLPPPWVRHTVVNSIIWDLRRISNACVILSFHSWIPPGLFWDAAVLSACLSARACEGDWIPSAHSHTHACTHTHTHTVITYSSPLLSEWNRDPCWTEPACAEDYVKAVNPFNWPGPQDELQTCGDTEVDADTTATPLWELSRVIVV